MSQTILQSTSVTSNTARDKSNETSAQGSANSLKFKGIMSGVKDGGQSGNQHEANYKVRSKEEMSEGQISGKNMPSREASDANNTIFDNAASDELSNGTDSGVNTEQLQSPKLTKQAFIEQLSSEFEQQSNNIIVSSSLKSQVEADAVVDSKTALDPNNAKGNQSAHWPNLPGLLSGKLDSSQLSGNLTGNLSQPLTAQVQANDSGKHQFNVNQTNGQFLNDTVLSNNLLNTQKHLFSDSMSLTFGDPMAADDKHKLASIVQGSLISDKPLKLSEQKASINFSSLISGETSGDEVSKLSRLESGLLFDAEKPFANLKYSSLSAGQNTTALDQSSLAAKSMSTNASMHPVLSSESNLDGKSAVKESTLNSSPLVLHSKNWQSSFTQKINWMRSGALERAEIQLDPKELGPLNIRVSQSNGELQITVQTSHSQTRELFELNQERLKEMLQEQGMNLSHFDVQSEQQNAESDDSLSENGKQNSQLANKDVDVNEEQSKTSQTTQLSLGQLDFFV